MMRMIGYALVLTGAGLLVGGCSTTNAWPVARNQAVAWNVDGAIPPQLRVPQGHRLLGYVVGRGTGTYTLQADPTEPDGRIWVQTANEGGELFDDVGDAIGHHGDNTWSTNNGNQVTGQPVAAVRQNNGTQWALYRATSNQGKGAWETRSTCFRSTRPAARPTRPTGIRSACRSAPVFSQLLLLWPAGPRHPNRPRRGRRVMQFKLLDAGC